MKADFETICGHEAAHAVMRHLVGLRCTRITATSFEGMCFGTGERVEAGALLRVTLAGFAWEAGFNPAAVDFENSKTVDFDEARMILKTMPTFTIVGQKAFIVDDPDEALAIQFQRTCELLCPYADCIEELGWRLELSGDLSARQVAAFMRSRVHL